MKYRRRILVPIFYMILGILLWGLGFAEIVDEFWSGMGGALLVVGVLRIIRIIRFEKDESYREKAEIEASDERNQFIRNKAWAWTGYLFILIAASLVIILKIMGQELLSYAASMAVCLMLILYWVSFLILKKKY